VATGEGAARCSSPGLGTASRGGSGGGADRHRVPLASRGSLVPRQPRAKIWCRSWSRFKNMTKLTSLGFDIVGVFLYFPDIEVIVSDGPHRSLKMRRPWQNVAEYADNPGFSPEEVGDALSVALANDWKTDIPPKVAQQVGVLLNEPQASLFSETRVQQLEALRPQMTGELGHLLIDHSIFYVTHRVPTDGIPSDQDASAAVGADVLRHWSARGARQVEEHYIRKSSQVHARDIRTRLEQSIARAVTGSLGRQLLGGGVVKAPLAIRRRTGIDDGVPL
jgi:hypothetical protein